MTEGPEKNTSIWAKGTMAPVFWSSDANRRLIGKVPDAGKDGGQKEKRESGDEMAGQHQRCNEHELGQTPGDGEGHGSLACCCPWGLKESDMTGWLNNKHHGHQFCRNHNGVGVHEDHFLFPGGPREGRR